MKDVAVIAIVVLIGFAIIGGVLYFKETAPVEVTVTGGADYTPKTEGTGVQATCDLTQKGTMIARSLNEITGGSATTATELWTKDHGLVAGQVNVSSATSVSTNVPMYFDGYILVGNDAEQSTTDTGTEYYYQKRELKYGCQGVFTEPDFLVAPEGTPTFTGYDDNTAETTLNVTIGSGATYVKASLKFEASADAYVGNPAFARPFALCFNESDSGTFDEIRPKNYDSIVPLPDYLEGYQYLSDCYVLPFGALKDGELSPEIPLYIKARSGQNPGVDNTSYATLIEYGFSKDDSGRWRAGWLDDSVEGTDRDLGIATFASCTKAINFA